MSPRRRRGRTAAIVAPLVVVAGLAVAAASSGAASESVTVERVIDGDTFVTTSGLHVRTLGIDACERSDPAGPRATALARELLPVGSRVELTREGRVDRDRYDRPLRYVTTSDGRDYGVAMVPSDAVAVYDGRNDASAAYVARLRAADPNGRDCGRP